MRAFSNANDRGRRFGAFGLGLIALLVVAQPASIVAHPSAAARVARAQRPTLAADDARLVSRGDERFQRIEKFGKMRAEGTPFADHEIEILDAWNAGLQIAQIEAETLQSRAIYRTFVQGVQPSDTDLDLIQRWRAYRLEHALDVQGRNMVLNGGNAGDAKAPDGSRDWELYWDPELYTQLSSAYQRNLCRRFGPHGKARKKAVGDNSGGAPTNPSATPPNTLVNDPTADATTQDTQSETTLALGTAPNILASFNDSGSDLAPNASFTGIARSTDGGTTFTDNGRLPASTQSDAGDPVLARNNTTGRSILTTLAFNSGAVLQSFRTDNDGASYQAPIDCDGGGTSNDKEWIACDNFAGTGNGNFYVFYRDFGSGGGMSFVRSTDGGATWSSRILLASASGQGAWVTVGADHAVYAFWLAGTSIVVRKSTDQGATFAAQSTVQTLRTTGTNGDLALQGGFRTNAFPQVVCSPTTAANLYMTWNDKGISPSTDKANTYFSQSTDSGATWSSAVQVNTDAGTNDNWQPCIAITPDGTGLFVSWYDRRLDVSNNLIDVFGRNATISGATVTFGNDYRITDTSFPVVIGQDSVIVATYMGDYDQAVADNANYYRTWGDNRLSRLSHANQPDVRFTKVPKAGPGPSLAANGVAITAESCTPANSAPDPGEVVTVNLTVTNGGTAATTNVVGTLLATGGVTSPSGPQTYGAIAVSGSVTKAYTFTVSGSCGGSVVMSLQLQDGTSNEGTVTYTLQIGTTSTQAFSNASSITINDNAAATPYPSNITVSGVVAYNRVTVSLTNLSHTFPNDIDIILVAPGGQKAYVMSDVGGSSTVSGINLVFDDNASGSIGTGSLSSGTFKPSNSDTSSDVFPAPAPAGPYSATFGAAFNGLGGAVNGTWSLYVRDDAGGDVGSIAGGWGITFITPVCSTSCSGGNIPPVANAGADQSVNACSVVTLNGSGSTDPDGGPMPLTYSWAQTGGPTVTINNPTSVMATFEAPNSASSVMLTFQLTVSDSAAMNSDTIVVTSNHVAGVHVDTIGLYVNSTNNRFLHNCNGPGPADVVVAFGASSNIPIRGDWDGNGTDTVGVYDATTSSFFLRNSNTGGAADIAFQFGFAGAMPLVGDWDGNGTVTVGIYDSTTSTFYLKNTNTPGAADITVQYGAAGSTPLTGDWDGNGSTTIGTYVPASGAFFLRNSNTPGAADNVFLYGAAGAGLKPLVGDWDGTGGDSIGVYDPVTSAFFLKNSNAGGSADIVFIFGLPGSYIPLAGNWDGF